MTNLQGKWALVTGSSRGVGKHVATALAGHGCNLVLHSREAAFTDALAEQLTTQGVQVRQWAVELSDEQALAGALDNLDTPIDVLYNNAAVMANWEDAWGAKPADFRRVFEINVIALVTITQAIAPGMIARGFGRIVQVTTGMAEQPQLSPYALSKAAVDKYVADLVPTLDGTGVTMNLLDPGWLKTDMGGGQAPNEVSSVLPGALIPILSEANGKLFRAQDFAGLSLEQALAKLRGS